MTAPFSIYTCAWTFIVTTSHRGKSEIERERERERESEREREREIAGAYRAWPEEAAAKTSTSSLLN